MNPQTHNPILYDALGKSILVGDKIVYAKTYGHSTALGRGVVLGIKFKDFGYRQQDVPRIKVQAEERHMGKWSILERNVTLGDTDKIVVVDDDAWETDNAFT